MTARTLQALLLTPQSFASFGDIIDAASAKKSYPINQGYSTRFHDLANIDVSDGGGEICVSIFRSKPIPPPVAIRLMERHPLGSQAFIPLERRPYLVVVAPAGDFKIANVRVFLARPDQGVNYAKGVWHHFLLGLEAPSDFLVIDRKGPGDNLDEVTLSVAEQFAVG
ncbi:MAG: ureidoglycolate lyase [Parvularculaceae bacterium]